MEVKKDSEVSITEYIAGVISQPAFIAGLGVASWLVLMGFSGWLYCRHRRRKQLGHYTTSFAYTPAGEKLYDQVLLKTNEDDYTDSSWGFDSLKVVRSNKRDELWRKGFQLWLRKPSDFVCQPVTVTHFKINFWGMP